MQSQPTELMSVPGPLNHSTPPRRFAIRSNNVILENYYEPTEAIILVEDEKITDVVIPKEMDSERLDQLYKDWTVQDYANLHIFPGLIDSNVHLHTDFDDEWENVNCSTELAAAGGVTMVVDNPAMNKPYGSGADYVASLTQRVEKLRESSKVDFGIFGILEPKTQEVVGKMVEAGVMGLKCYLLSCLQNTIGHFSSEMLPEVIKDLENYSDLLLMIHPEVATERELYLSSPCRTVPLEKRLDMKHTIKSLELGGAANKGSYLEELCKKSSSNNDDDDDDDDDCPTATLDTPTKLRSKIKKTKERNEIDDIVHFELLSYGYNNPKNEVVEGGDSSDSDDDEIAHKGKKGKSTNADQDHKDAEESLKVKTLSLESEQAEGSKDQGDKRINTIDSKSSKLEIGIPHSSAKKSRFARSSNQIVETIQESDDDVQKDTFGEACKQAESLKEATEMHLNHENKSQKQEEDQPARQEAPQMSRMKPQTQRPIQSMGLKAGLSGLDSTRNLVQTRKLLSFITACDVQHAQEKTKIQSLGCAPVINMAMVNDKENMTSVDAISEHKPILLKDHPEKSSSLSTIHLLDSPQNTEVPVTHFSPALSSKPMTPASSSLLLRRISRKPSNGMTISVASTLSSPSSDFTKVNSLDVLKSPRGLAKKEAKYNQNYRIFLANRPQSWEENAVTLILSSLHPETNLRVMLPNLSLASSFLKIREKKKSNEAFLQKIYSDTSAAHLFFNEKMVKKSETKYKISPPFRNKENRRLLVENLRLGGIDVMSSYHFYVPPKYKQVDDGNFRRAFGGIDSIGYSLQGVWTAAYSYQIKTNKKFSDDLMYQKKIINHILRQIYKTMAHNPAQMLRISERKGTIAKGRDADFVVWDPYKVTNNSDLRTNHVFAGRAVLGNIHKTYLRGKLIYDVEDTERISKSYQAEFIRP